MENKRAIARYRETLHENLYIVQALERGELAAEYPQLSSYAAGKGAGMFARLEELLLYFIDYGTVNENPYPSSGPETSQEITVRKDSSRGGVKVVDMYCSYEYMAAGFPRPIEGGRGKKEEAQGPRHSEAVWKGVIARLTVLGLLWVYKPGAMLQDNSEEYKRSRTRAAMQASQRSGWSRPVNHYSVPVYRGSNGALRRAEGRVAIVASLGAEGCRDKDLVRRALARKLGTSRAAREADLIFCNSYERHVRRDEKETILCAALVMELRRSGFAYPETVVYYAEHGQDKYSRGALRRIWETHRAVILERCGAIFRRPTKSEKRLLGLMGDKHILTAKGDLPAFDVELKEPDREREPPF